MTLFIYPRLVEKIKNKKIPDKSAWNIPFVSRDGMGKKRRKCFSKRRVYWMAASARTASSSDPHARGQASPAPQPRPRTSGCGHQRNLSAAGDGQVQLHQPPRGVRGAVIPRHATYPAPLPCAASSWHLHPCWLGTVHYRWLSDCSRHCRSAAGIALDDSWKPSKWERRRRDPSNPKYHSTMGRFPSCTLETMDGDWGRGKWHERHRRWLLSGYIRQVFR